MEAQRIFEELHKELGTCVDSVESIDNLTEEVERQRASVIKSLSLLNSLAQDNAAVAEETSAMSSELSKAVDNSAAIVTDLENKVEILMDNIHKFRL